MWFGELTLRLRNWLTETAAANGPFGNHATLTDGLVSYWALDEQSGTRYDSVTASANDLTDNNTVTYQSRGPQGDFANVIAANSESLSNDSFPDLSAASWTFASWAIGGGSGAARLVRLTDGVLGSGNHMHDAILNSNQFYINVYDSVAGISQPFINIQNPTLSYPRFLVWGYDASTKKGWVSIDGQAKVENGAALSNGMRSGGTHFCSGESSGFSDEVIGRMGYWTTKLSDAEILALYNSGNGKSYADLTTAEKVSLGSYWDLTEASGTRNDSHSTNHLTDNNTVGSTTNVGGAVRNVGANFVAANSESLSHADTNVLDFAGDLTVVAWANLSDTSTTRRVVTKTAPGEQGYHLSFTASRWRFGNISGIGEANDGGVGVSTGVWYFLAGKRESGVYTLVVNGITYTGNTDGADLSNTGPFRIGARNPTATEFMDGSIDEVGVWSRALTAQELSDLFNAGNGLFYGD